MSKEERHCPVKGFCNTTQPVMSSSTTAPLPKAHNLNSIIVNVNQRGNPVLKYINNVAWEHGETVADYEVGRTSCAFFLSLRYHKLHPNYIYERFQSLGKKFNLRILLILVDVVCQSADISLILLEGPQQMPAGADESMRVIGLLLNTVVEFRGGWKIFGDI